MIIAADAIFGIYNAWINFFIPTFRDKPITVDHTNAKYKVIRISEIQEVYYSNAQDEDAARAEAWTAFNINKPGIKKSRSVPEFLVLDNPHRKYDDDGYDIITGLKKQ